MSGKSKLVVAKIDDVNETLTKICSALGHPGMACAGNHWRIFTWQLGLDGT